MVAFKVVSDLFDLIVNYLILFVELIGIGILLYAVISAVIGLIKRQPHTRLKLAEGIAGIQDGRRVVAYGSRAGVEGTFNSRRNNFNARGAYLFDSVGN